MIKKLLILFFTFYHLSSFSQYVRNSYEKNSKNYFISYNYGIGSGIWFSQFKNTNLYDKYGYVIKSGNLRFKTQTSIQYQDIAVMVPVSKIIIGAGINFEEHIMETIDIKKSSINVGQRGDGELLYDQKFRFDKIYVLAELPLTNEESKFYLGARARLGYFGYYGADRENFFGEENIAQAYFCNVGVIASFKFLKRIQLFVNPKYDYDFFYKRSIEVSSKITHHIHSFSVGAGLRYDVGSL